MHIVLAGKRSRGRLGRQYSIAQTGVAICRWCSVGSAGQLPHHMLRACELSGALSSHETDKDYAERHNMTRIMVQKRRRTAFQRLLASNGPAAGVRPSASPARGDRTAADGRHVRQRRGKEDTAAMGPRGSMPGAVMLGSAEVHGLGTACNVSEQQPTAAATVAAALAPDATPAQAAVSLGAVDCLHACAAV